MFYTIYEPEKLDADGCPYMDGEDQRGRDFIARPAGAGIRTVGDGLFPTWDCISVNYPDGSSQWVSSDKVFFVTPDDYLIRQIEEGEEYDPDLIDELVRRADILQDGLSDRYESSAENWEDVIEEALYILKKDAEAQARYRIRQAH